MKTENEEKEAEKGTLKKTLFDLVTSSADKWYDGGCHNRGIIVVIIIIGMQLHHLKVASSGFDDVTIERHLDVMTSR